MTHEVLFAGVGGTVLGTIVGAWVTARLTYGFQKKLLEQHLRFLDDQAKADAQLRQQFQTEWSEKMDSLWKLLNTRARHILGRMPDPNQRADQDAEG